MQQIEVRLFAYFRDGRGKRLNLEIKENTTVQNILDTLKIDKELVSILLINGTDGKFESVLKDGDRLSIFPPVGGG